jgi:AraC family transcriptional regulator, regulatory protein of adaptative response / DNA-3-methyladenine glycosylase II
MQLSVAICDRARMARDARFDGRFFIAVLSTGVYCRPICPSPHARRENVRYFRSADEAVAAGFRPCLRCRPEAAPGTPRWNGTASTVSRALRLIEEGALRERGLSDLSRRLGVSARQLHRLFSIHLGASPTAVAKTWRLSFAKRLLREADLPMANVALEAGFRTVRRFNDAIRSRYGRTPSQLRRLPEADADALAAARDAYVARLAYRAPYDWDSLLEFLAARAIRGLEEVVAGAYRRTISHEGRHGVLEVRHDPRSRALDVRVRIADLASLLPILTRVRGMFDVDADTTAIARHLSHQPLMGGLVRRYPGLRVPGAWDPFEMSVRAVLGESMAGGAGAALCALTRRFGERLSVPNAGGLSLVFPSAEALAKARLAELPSDRARSIRSLAEIALAGADEESLQNLPGVAESTAQYVAIRALRQPDAFPSEDPVLLRAAGLEDPPTAASLVALAQRWRPWRAYAAFYLWRQEAERGPSGRRFGRVAAKVSSALAAP